MSAPGFEYFKSTDSGAPALYGAAGRMIAVLDWVLVTKGGWAKAFTGTNLASYRSETGNRFYLCVDDTQALIARARGYRTMSAVSTGTNPWPAVALTPLVDFGVGKSATAGSTARRYWGVRTNKYVFLAVEMDGSSTGAGFTSVLAFGDVPSLCEADTFNTVLLGTNSTAYKGFPLNYISQVISQNAQGGVVPGAHMAATPSGGVTAPASVLTSLFAPIGSVYGAVDAGYSASGRLQLDNFTICTNQSGSGTGIPIARAVLPNVKHGVGVLPRAGLALEEVVTVGSKTFVLIPSLTFDATANGFFALEISDTDGAL